MNRKVLCAAIAASFAGAAAGQQIATDPAAEPSGGVVPLTYVGGNARIGLGIDQDGDVTGEGLGIFGYDGTRAFLAEGWLGHGGAGGVKFGYNWLWGGRTVQDTIDAPDGVLVAKAFGALDRNAFDDRKATVGLGFEKRDTSVDVYYSHALSDERLIASTTLVERETITGSENGRPYRQEITTLTTTDQFERPYRHGLGVRFGRFLDGPALRLRAGLDYERGSDLLDGDNASQVTGSLGVEKQFRGTGHSLALSLEHLRKSGPFEDRIAPGRDRSDTRGALLWRYEFGGAFRPVEAFREVEHQREVVEPAPGGDAPRVLRNEVELSGEALFAFDSATVAPAAQAELAGLVAALRERRVGEVAIVGHTCDLGPAAYNQGLSERRAAAVRDWLVAQGVPAADLVVSGRGEEAPRHANDSAANRARNRRVELSFVTVEETVLPPEPPVTRTVTGWRREPVPQPAAWIERALRNPPAHKRAVDTYLVEQESVDRIEGPREFINRPPVAVDDVATTARDTAVAIAVLANDSDPDGDALTVLSATQPGNGSVVVGAGGVITYTPAAGFTGSDAFGYTIADPDGLTATATVTVTVQPPANLPPVANPDSAVTRTGEPVQIDVLANDSDPDGDPLAVAAVGQPGNGTAVLGGDGRITYTSLPGFTGTDTFSYTVEDGRGGSAVGQVTVLVNPAGNRPPLARPDFVDVLKGGRVDIDVLANDSDPDGDPLTVTQVSYSNNWALVTINANGTVRYDHRPGTFGTDYIDYEITDGRGGFAWGRVTIEVIRP